MEKQKYVQVIAPEGFPGRDVKCGDVITDPSDIELIRANGRYGVRLDHPLRSKANADREKENIEGALGYDLDQLDGVGEELKTALGHIGIFRISDLAKAEVDDLTPLHGVGKKTAVDLIATAKEFLDPESSSG